METVFVLSIPIKRWTVKCILCCLMRDTLKASLIPGMFYYKYFSGIKVLQVINLGTHTERSLQAVKDKTVCGLSSVLWMIKLFFKQSLNKGARDGSSFGMYKLYV